MLGFNSAPFKRSFGKKELDPYGCFIIFWGEGGVVFWVGEVSDCPLQLKNISTGIANFCLPVSK